VIERWVRFGGEGGDVEALPAPTPSSAATPAAQTTSPQSDPPLVQEPSLAEEMNDALPDDLAPPAQTAPDSALADVQRCDRDGFRRQSQAEQEARDWPH
jgi:hypothetical protein